ncbi:polysaccharide deacetylase family protein [Paenibacillus sp. YIM B09110]|uniref:polysaccharide deacetylase family protein n=1 Tax=Paenibacillus sp. YIM B09110 TaxID=3126102 RepID=UPI00301DF776
MRRTFSNRYSFLSVLLIAMVNLLFITACTGPISGVSKKPIDEQRVIALMYHDVAMEESADRGATISLEKFKEHLSTLKDNGYTIINMEQFYDFVHHGKSVPDKSVVLTFDDGYQSFYSLAYPALKEEGATASVFVIGESSDMFNPDALPHLTWDEMRELDKNGMGVYNHTYKSHFYGPATIDGQMKPALAYPLYLAYKKRMETPDEYKQRIYSDMAFMEKRLANELGKSDGIMAIPYGSYNEMVIEEAEKAGISLFFTTKEGLNKTGEHEVYRLNAGRPNYSGDQLMASINTLK